MWRISVQVTFFLILNVSLPVKNVRVQQIVNIYEAEANIIILAKAKRVLC